MLLHIIRLRLVYSPRLIPDPVFVVPIETMWIGIRNIVEDAEPAIRNIPAVEVGRRRRDTVILVGGMTDASSFC